MSECDCEDRDSSRCPVHVVLFHAGQRVGGRSAVYGPFTALIRWDVHKGSAYVTVDHVDSLMLKFMRASVSIITVPLADVWSL